MITLEDNTIRFGFPEIKDELAKLTTSRASELACQFMAEDLVAALQDLLETNWQYSATDEEYRKKALRHLSLLSKTEVENAITHYVKKSGVTPDPSGSAPVLSISCQRTLRIPDDGKTYPLPPSLGQFPLFEIDDYAQAVPQDWLKRGGVMMPMYQSEALWLNFDSAFPCAVKVATGKVNAISGKTWLNRLNQSPQDYLVTPQQPWLDGYNVAQGLIRQFVAMPLEKGYSVEEQITGKDEYGGLQLQVFPLKAQIYFEEKLSPEFPDSLADVLPFLLPKPPQQALPPAAPAPKKMTVAHPRSALPSKLGMGFGPGGRMRQEIYQDARPLTDWDTEHTSRCFVHLCNSHSWKQITGEKPPAAPITAKEYERHKLPWFDYYRDDLAAIEGSTSLPSVKTVSQIAKNNDAQLLPGNESVEVNNLIQFGKARRPGSVREWLGD